MDVAGRTGGWRALLEIFLSTFKIGATTFGGGFAMIPVMEREFVYTKKWIRAEDIVDVFAICQSVPGVISLNASVFVGYRVRGVPGAVAAVAGLCMPSVIILSVISVFYAQFRENQFIEHALRCVRACVVALIISAVLSLKKTAVTNIFGWVIACLALLVEAIWLVNPIIVILSSGTLGWLYGRWKKP